MPMLAPNGDTIIPPSLDTPEFREAWEAFLQLRTAKRAPLTEYAAKIIFNRLIKLPLHGAILCVNNSVERGYTGIDPKWILNQNVILCEPVDRLWDRWRNARRSVGVGDPAHTVHDVKVFEALAAECKTGAEYWHVFQAYCKDSDDWLSRLGHPIDQLPRRLNLYVSVLTGVRTQAKQGVQNEQPATPAAKVVKRRPVAFTPLFD